MSALTFNLIRLAFLVLLWLFVLVAIGVLRRDLLTRGRAVRKAAQVTSVGAGLGATPVPVLAGAGSVVSGVDYSGAPLGSAPVVDLPVTVVGPGAEVPVTVVGSGASPTGSLGYSDGSMGSVAGVSAGSAGPSALVVTAGALNGTWIPLTTDTITIGRSPDNTLVLDDGYASGRHARIFPQSGQWYLEDLASTNGTLLAGQPVNGTVPLPIGMPIKIGGSEIELVS